MAGSAPAYTYYYLSDLLSSWVWYEWESAPLGRLGDIGVQKTAPYPQACSIEVRSHRTGPVTLPWSGVVSIANRQVTVRKQHEAPPQADFWLRRDVLDTQVVDLSGAKVHRVNDVHLIYAEGQLVAAHVGVGYLGILRRLGFDKPVAALLRWLLDYTMKDTFVSWRHVELVGRAGTVGAVRVATTDRRFADMHPAEIADVLEQLGVKERHALFQTLDVETAAETLEEVAPGMQRLLIAQEEPGKAADVLEEMPAKEAAHLLREMTHTDAERIISRMESDEADDVRTLLAHEEKSAGGVMTASCIEARPDEMAASVMARVREMAEESEVFNTIFVLDEARHLVGVVSLRELLRAAPGATLDTLMTTSIIKVAPDANMRDVAGLFVKYGVRAIPVVGEDDTFLGAVRLKNIVGELPELLRR